MKNEWDVKLLRELKAKGWQCVLPGLLRPTFYHKEKELRLDATHWKGVSKSFILFKTAGDRWDDTGLDIYWSVPDFKMWSDAEILETMANPLWHEAKAIHEVMEGIRNG